MRGFPRYFIIHYTYHCGIKLRPRAENFHIFEVRLYVVKILVYLFNIKFAWKIGQFLLAEMYFPTKQKIEKKKIITLTKLASTQ